MILYWYALDDKSLDTVILHVGVNGLLNSNTQSNVDNQKNINKLESEIFFVRFGVSIFILRVRNLISNYCRENEGFLYIKRGICLHKDGLHLLESGKKILANIFIVNLNNLWLERVHMYLFELKHEN